MDIVVGSLPDRQLALVVAAGLVESGQERHPVLEVAQSLWTWLQEVTASLTVTVTVTDAKGTTKSTTQVSQGGTDVTNMTMDDTITLAVATKDDHGDATSDAVTFVGDDNGTLLSLAVSGNTATGTPLAEGTVNVTVADPSAPNVAPAVVQIVIGPGPTSSIQVTPTVNTGANVVPPPPAPAGP